VDGLLSRAVQSQLTIQLKICHQDTYPADVHAELLPTGVWVNLQESEKREQLIHAVHHGCSRHAQPVVGLKIRGRL
jgi:hypothetical protein